MYRTDLQVQDRNRYRNTDTGIYVTLCVFSIEKISLALLMQKRADFRMLGSIVSTELLYRKYLFYNRA